MHCVVHAADEDVLVETDEANSRGLELDDDLADLPVPDRVDLAVPRSDGDPIARLCTSVEYDMNKYVRDNCNGFTRIV